MGRIFLLFTMKLPQSSRTAEYMAFFRALETIRPPHHRLFADPFALRFIRPFLPWPTTKSVAKLKRLRLRLGQVLLEFALQREPC